MTDFSLLVDLHKNTERQGPGSEQETLRALACIDLPRQGDYRVADIGCGTGSSTLTLAQELKGTITAVDLFPAFLEVLNQRAIQLGLEQQIEPLQASMDALPFEQSSYDLLWSEGAIYNIGFERGIQLWKDFLKIGGFLAVSEITWTTQLRPKEIETFWQQEYPEIATAAQNIQILEKHGYALTGYLVLKENSWLDNYYLPLEAEFPDFLERWQHSFQARQVVQEHLHEIQLYRQYKAYYSYGFYIARRER